jgi:hypothetical protein
MAAVTCGLSLSTRETDMVETPACAATSAIPTIGNIFPFSRLLGGGEGAAHTCVARFSIRVPVRCVSCQSCHCAYRTG